MGPLPQAKRLRSFSALAAFFITFQVLNGPQGGTAGGSLLSQGFGLAVAQLVFQGVVVGWTEEYLFRGSIQRALNFKWRQREIGRGVKAGTLVVSALFGVSHFVNLLLGQGFLGTMVQALGAIVVGLIFGTYYDAKDDLAGIAWLHNIADFVPLLLSL